VSYWSQVQALTTVLSNNNLGQVVHTHVLLSASSITWHRQQLGHKQAHHAMFHIRGIAALAGAWLLRATETDMNDASWAHMSWEGL